MQLSIKDVDSASWFIELKKIFLKYDLPDINHLLDNPHKKEKWKTHVYRYWQDEIKWITACLLAILFSVPSSGNRNMLFKNVRAFMCIWPSIGISPDSM
jgi:hypothetical protein